MNEEIIRADSAITEEVKRAAGGLVKIPGGDFQIAVIGINWVALVEADLGQAVKNGPTPGVAIELPKNESFKTNIPAAGQKFGYFAAIVFVKHARYFNRNPRLAHNFGQVGDAG